MRHFFTMLLLSVLLGAAVALSAAPSAAQTARVVEGTVLNAASGQPLAGVVIAAKAHGDWREVGSATGLDGAFAFDPAAVLRPDERDSRFLTLRFTKEGFRPWLRKIRADRGGFFWSGSVGLSPENGVADLSADERATLDRLQSASGRTLFLVPYQLIGLGGGASSLTAEQVNTLLPFHLRRGIVDYLQRLEVGLADGGVSLETLPLAVSPTNSERLLAYGRHLRALGVIGGLGTVGGQPGGGQPGGAPPGAATVDVSSIYHIIPTVAEVALGEVSVDDRLPQEKLTSMELYRDFNSLWGRATVIAIAVRTFQAARVAGDRAALADVEALLVQERKSVGPGRQEYEAELNDLVAAVRAEAARLGPAGGGSR